MIQPKLLVIKSGKTHEKNFAKADKHYKK